MSEKTIKNIDELLQMFVSHDEQRPKFLKPWRERNHVFASEMHILIRVNSTLTNTEYPQCDSDSNKLFPVGEPHGILTAETLENAISYPPGMKLHPCCTPRQAYAAFIDRIYRPGTWDANPYVFVYDFELVK